MEHDNTVSRLQPSKVIPIRMDAAFFCERAVRSLDHFHYEKALRYFRRATEYEPDNAVNHCNMAGILSEMGNYEESNDILLHILANLNPDMTECYFYMANNYANMDDFVAAEKALVRYLELDEQGQFLEDAEEMMELLGYELGRPTNLKTIKSREGLFEHDKARKLLEDGKFTQAAKLLVKVIKKNPDMLAARNNLALAYFYIGDFERTLTEIRAVLAIDPGNLHALCNLAIFYQHFDRQDDLAPLVERLNKTVPYHIEQVFKIATTMGILQQHEAAYNHLRRLLASGEAGEDACLYHYAAVAAYNIGRTGEAKRLWTKAAKLDPDAEIAKFYLSELHNGLPGGAPLSYHYHLPFEEQIRLPAHKDELGNELKKNPLVRSSFFWALRHGDYETKLMVLQAFGKVKDRDAERALRLFLLEAEEDEYLKKVALFVLRGMGVKEPVQAVMNGKRVQVDPTRLAPGLPVWKANWQAVVEKALAAMDKRYGMLEQHDLQTLWVEYLTRAYPDVPQLAKIEGWAAALEYLTAKMHRREISYQEVAMRYDVSVQTISKHVKTIDRVCGLQEKMEAIFPHFHEKL